MATSDLERMFDDWTMAWSSNDFSNDPERVLALFVDDCVFEDEVTQKREQLSPHEWHFKIPRSRRSGGFAPANSL